jgi:glyoxylase-like metal-dependent hydrolase (beta-lactamase superfamily II)
MINHNLHQISPHVYWLTPDSTTDRPLLGAVDGARGTLQVDAGNSPGHAHILRDKIAEHGLAAPSYGMLTHWHWDHVFGSAALDVPTFAHAETQRIVRIMARLDWSDAALDQRVAEGVEIEFCQQMIKAELPDRSALVIRPPEIGFGAEVELSLGGVTCQIFHVGGDHSPDSSVVYIPEDKIVFLGDCIYDDLYHGPRRCTAAVLFPLLDRLLAYEADFYLAAHHTEPLRHAQLAEEAALLKTIGGVIAAYGDDRAAILAQLPSVLGTPLADDHIAIADAFLAGWRLPVTQSVM